MSDCRNFIMHWKLSILEHNSRQSGTKSYQLVVCSECITDMYRKKSLRKKLHGRDPRSILFILENELSNVIPVLLLLIMKCIINEAKFLAEITHNSKIIIMHSIYKTKFHWLLQFRGLYLKCSLYYSTNPKDILVCAVAQKCELPFHVQHIYIYIYSSFFLEFLSFYHLDKESVH